MKFDRFHNRDSGYQPSIAAMDYFHDNDKLKAMVDGVAICYTLLQLDGSRQEASGVWFSG